MACRPSSNVNLITSNRLIALRCMKKAIHQPGHVPAQSPIRFDRQDHNSFLATPRHDLRAFLEGPFNDLTQTVFSLVSWQGMHRRPQMLR